MDGRARYRDRSDLMRAVHPSLPPPPTTHIRFVERYTYLACGGLSQPRLAFPPRFIYIFSSPLRPLVVTYSLQTFMSHPASSPLTPRKTIGSAIVVHQSAQCLLSLIRGSRRRELVGPVEREDSSASFSSTSPLPHTDCERSTWRTRKRRLSFPVSRYLSPYTYAASILTDRLPPAVLQLVSNARATYGLRHQDYARYK